MTTTPDSRIRADWTLPADTAAAPPSLGAIDTSTTAGKIAVMQARERGERIEVRARQSILSRWYDVDAGELVWDWKFNDYRIAPPVPTLQAAREYNRMNPPDGHRGANLLRDLLREIRESSLMTVHGDGHLKQIHMTIEALTPGRYRLVRDDA